MRPSDGRGGVRHMTADDEMEDLAAFRRQTQGGNGAYVHKPGLEINEGGDFDPRALEAVQRKHDSGGDKVLLREWPQNPPDNRKRTAGRKKCGTPLHAGVAGD